MAREAPATAAAAAPHLLRPLAGGDLSARPPLLTQDAKFMFVAVGNAVRVVSTRTGEPVRLLEGHTGAVTAMCLNPTNVLQLFTASRDGSVRVWDFEEAQCLREVAMGAPIAALFAVVAPGRDTTTLYWVGSAASGTKQTARRWDFDDDATAAPRKSASVKASSVIMEVVGARAWALHEAAQALVAVAGKAVYVANLALGTTQTWPWSHGLVNVACHPTEPSFVTGDSQGKIVVWRGAIGSGSNSASPPVTSTLHWHAHATHTLCFNSDGTYLLSGGDEAVLVMWQMLTSRRRFLPRLGAPVVHIAISSNDALYVVTCADNSIKVIEASTLNAVSSFQGFKRESHGLEKKPDVYACGLKVDPRTGCVVTAGTTGTLQVYDAVLDRHVRDVQVVERNFISGTNAKRVRPCTIAFVAFAKDGNSMATLERRADRISGGDMRLKLWHFDGNSQSYVLSTCVEPPHQARVTGLVGSAHKNLFVTSAMDGTTKVWQPNAELNPEEPDARGWGCAAVADYHQQPCHACALSGDGSLMAVAVSGAVVLWDVQSCTVRRVLPIGSKRISHLVFLESAAAVLVATRTQASLWSLLSCRMLWSSTAPILRVTAHTSAPEFAVATATEQGACQHVARYTVSDGTVVLQGAAPWPAGAPLADMVYAPLVAEAAPGQPKPQHLLALGSDTAVYVLAAPGAAAAPTRAGSADLSAPMYRTRLEDEVDASAQRYRALFGGAVAGSSTSNSTSSGVLHETVPARTAGAPIVPADAASVDTMLDGPAHVLPPMPLLAERFLHLTLLKTLGGPPPLSAASDDLPAGGSSALVRSGRPLVAVEETDGDGASAAPAAVNKVTGQLEPTQDYLPSRASFDYLRNTFAQNTIVDAPLMLARAVRLDEMETDEDGTGTSSSSAKRKAAATPDKTAAGSSNSRERSGSHASTPSARGGPGGTPHSGSRGSGSARKKAHKQGTPLAKAAASTNGTPVANGSPKSRRKKTAGSNGSTPRNGTAAHS